VLIIHARGDPLIPFSDAEALEAAHPGAMFVASDG
jgi:hypothetical protein